ncbi:hypothetical protein [Bradyrhizobium sp.]|uniref:hypothetical protein n=1 Tax=Bradyrhizobium sp. TaxID=376 RepID=UPI003C72A5CA
MDRGPNQAALRSRQRPEAKSGTGSIDCPGRQISPRTKLRRRFALVEDGVTDLDEVLKVRLADIKADRDRPET